MQESYGFSHGIKVLTADETVKGNFMSMKVVGQNSVTITAKTNRGSDDLPSITIDKNDQIIPGPFTEITKTGGSGTLIIFRYQR